MDDLPTLRDRARALREKIVEFIEQFGDLHPNLSRLRDELEIIEKHLKTLGDQGQDDPTTRS